MHIRTSSFCKKDKPHLEDNTPPQLLFTYKHMSTTRLKMYIHTYICYIMHCALSASMYQDADIGVTYNQRAVTQEYCNTYIPEHGWYPVFEPGVQPKWFWNGFAFCFRAKTIRPPFATRPFLINFCQRPYRAISDQNNWSVRGCCRPF